MVASDGVVLTRRQSVHYLLIVTTEYSGGSCEGSTQATMLHNTKYLHRHCLHCIPNTRTTDYRISAFI